MVLQEPRRPHERHVPDYDFVRGTGEANVIIRAKPLSDILAHCHPSFSRTGAAIDAVVHETPTS